MKRNMNLFIKLERQTPTKVFLTLSLVESDIKFTIYNCFL